MCALVYVTVNLVSFIPLLVFPLIYHAIDEEIPEVHRPTIKRLFQLWFVLLGTLVINMVACIFILVGGSAAGGADLGSSLGSVDTFEF
jgi:hypothetical protein